MKSDNVSSSKSELPDIISPLGFMVSYISGIAGIPEVFVAPSMSDNIILFIITHQSRILT